MLADHSASGRASPRELGHVALDPREAAGHPDQHDQPGPALHRHAGLAHPGPPVPGRSRRHVGRRSSA
ncbi:MAG: hypothetical protein M0C28_00810 [Candidatus Moduliflexus flocculans]|nr:hypothetical protein [Candidatus Moduliflexus flocculans]